MYYTHNYKAQADELSAKGMSQNKIAKKLIKRFEKEAKVALIDADARDYGGLAMWYHINETEVAFFDCEQFVGNVVAINGFESSDFFGD